MQPYILSLCVVGALAGGQILFKLAASRIQGRTVIEIAGQTSFLFPFFVALFVYAVSTVLWVMALRDLPLSRAYMFMSLSFIIVPAISALLFKEQLTPGFLVGVALIAAGLVITQVFG